MAHHYYDSQGEADRIVKSYPFKVRFAGFTGDTLSLAAAGWAFSMHQQMNPYHGQILLQLALKHEGMGQYAVTQQLQIDRHFHSPQSFMETLVHYADMGLEVMHCAPSIRTVVHSLGMTTTRNFQDMFSPIDPNPTYTQFDMSDLRFFRPANPSLKDVLVTPEQVPELMEMILKEQKKVLSEVKKREESRKNYEQYRGSVNGIPVKNSHEVQIQLVTVA